MSKAAVNAILDAERCLLCGKNWSDPILFGTNDGHRWRVAHLCWHGGRTLCACGHFYDTNTSGHPIDQELESLYNHLATFEDPALHLMEHFVIQQATGQ